MGVAVHHVVLCQYLIDWARLLEEVPDVRVVDVPAQAVGDVTQGLGLVLVHECLDDTVEERRVGGARDDIVHIEPRIVKPSSVHL